MRFLSVRRSQRREKHLRLLRPFPLSWASARRLFSREEEMQRWEEAAVYKEFQRMNRKELVEGDDQMRFRSVHQVYFTVLYK